MGGMIEPSPFGPDIEPERAPEAISSVVASLPPEQMFELAKQMKHCVQTNPLEAREMLLQNPQLSYALLQALVVMRVVDPNIAMGMLHRENGAPFVPPVGGQVPVPPFGSPINDFNNRGAGPPMGGGMAIDPRRDPRTEGRIDPRMQGRQDPRLMPQQQPSVEDTDQRSRILSQVINLTDVEISQLPPEQRNAVIMLKQEIANRGMH
jgi:cleavage stimulation factor subunit 2